MSASVGGLPYAMQRIPVEGSRDMGRHPGMNSLDEQLEIGDGRVRKDTVSEVEDVARAPARAPQHVTCAIADEIGRTEQHRGVKVALDCAGVADSPPALLPPHPPIHPDQVATGFPDPLGHSPRLAS